ncbi:unnamed protein product [Symbiodinium sp. CCMP2456]|nr:unnamed protein product [Symbiodinium sp. CCMP2456]
MVELKNGETYSGVLASCDGFMNLHMRDIVCTSRDGERFWKIPECYVRGNSIKYLRLPDEVIDMVKDEPQSRKDLPDLLPNPTCIEKPTGATDFGRWLDPTSVARVY